MTLRTAHYSLPYPPTVNHYYGEDRRTGHKFIKPRGRAYREAVVLLMRQQGVICFPGPLAIRVDVWFPDRRKRDQGNLEKALYDALEAGGCCKDDWQFRIQHYAPRGVEKPGRVVVFIDELPADPLDDDTLWRWIAGTGLHARWNG